MSTHSLIRTCRTTEQHDDHLDFTNCFLGAMDYEYIYCFNPQTKGYWLAIFALPLVELREPHGAQRAAVSRTCLTLCMRFSKCPFSVFSSSTCLCASSTCQIWAEEILLILYNWDYMPWWDNVTCLLILLLSDFTCVWTFSDSSQTSRYLCICDSNLRSCGSRGWLTTAERCSNIGNYLTLFSRESIFK